MDSDVYLTVMAEDSSWMLMADFILFISRALHVREEHYTFFHFNKIFLFCFIIVFKKHLYFFLPFISIHLFTHLIKISVKING